MPSCASLWVKLCREFMIMEQKTFVLQVKFNQENDNMSFSTKPLNQFLFWFCVALISNTMESFFSLHFQLWFQCSQNKAFSLGSISRSVWHDFSFILLRVICFQNVADYGSPQVPLIAVPSKHLSSIVVLDLPLIHLNSFSGLLAVSPHSNSSILILISWSA